MSTNASNSAGADQAATEAAYPHWRRNRLAMTFATFHHTTAFGVITPFFPLILLEYGVTGRLETWVGYAQGSYFLLSFFLSPLWGAVADHYGRKLMVLRTSFGMAFVFALLPLMPNLTWFLVLYFFMGTTNGFVPASQALIATNTPSNRLSGALSFVQVGVLLGATLGPAFGAGLMHYLPKYTYLMWVATCLICVGGTSALILAREQHTRPKEPFRLHTLRDIKVVVRLPYLKLLFFIYFTNTFTYLGSAAIVSVFTLDLLNAQGISSGPAVDWWIGAVSLAFTIGSALTVPVWGRLADRFGGRIILALSLAGAGLMSLLIPLSHNTGQLVAARLLLGMAAVGIGPTALAQIKSYAPKGMESRVLAFGAAFGMLGIGGGPFLAGLIGPVFGLRTFFFINSALLLLAFVGWSIATTRGAIMDPARLRKRAERMTAAMQTGEARDSGQQADS